jgi:hypothetical protein
LRVSLSQNTWGSKNGKKGKNNKKLFVSLALFALFAFIFPSKIYGAPYLLHQHGFNNLIAVSFREASASGMAPPSCCPHILSPAAFRREMDAG